MNEKWQKKYKFIFFIFLSVFLSLLIFQACPEVINWNTKGLELYKNGKYKEAIECFDKVLNHDPGAFKVWNNKGNALYKLGNYDKALICYNKSIEINHEYGNAWYGKGCTMIKIKKYDEALECFNKVLEFNPDDSDAKNKKQEILGELDIIENEKIMEYFHKGNFLYIQEYYTEAIDCYDKILSYNHNSVEALYCKGCALNSLKKYREALNCFDRLLEIAPNHKEGKIKRDKLYSELGNYISPVMVFIKGRKDNIIRNFYISKYEITNREFSKFAPDRISKGDDLPAVNITWYEAADYCNWLSRKEGLTPCYSNKTDTGEYKNISSEENGYRLPEESEWEYACSAGSTSDYYWGNDMDRDFCWYYENSELKSHPPGQKKPNKYGLYDMSGNVWEWCRSLDTYVIRGGGFLEESYKCTSFYSTSMHITKSIDIGFRIVRKE